MRARNACAQRNKHLCRSTLEPPANFLRLLRALLLFTFFSLRGVICQAGLLSFPGHQTLLDYDRSGTKFFLPHMDAHGEHV